MLQVLPHEVRNVYEYDYTVLRDAMGDWVEDNDIDDDDMMHLKSTRLLPTR